MPTRTACVICCIGSVLVLSLDSHGNDGEGCVLERQDAVGDPFYCHYNIPTT